MKLTQTITKSLGILALILTFSLSASAQSRTITTNAAGGCSNSGCPPVKTFVKYNPNSNTIQITLTQAPNNAINHSRVYLVNLRTGALKNFSKSYTKNQTRTYSLTGMNNQLVVFVIIDETGRASTWRFHT